eukprot:GHVR01174582.1.p1 GENE.GHVR01174582.1~~GHVR01174582.1.p1  ORF type:complete len:183 (-),score=36.16 GHVR01174582.1:70-618(-)
MATEDFCGFVRLSVMDVDGLEKRLKGSCFEAPLKLSYSNDKVILTSYLPITDPIRYIQITTEDNDYISAIWWKGCSKRASHMRSPYDRTVAVLNTLKTKPVVELLDDQKSTFIGQAAMPYINDPYKRLVTVKFNTKEAKFITRIISVEIEIPIEYWKEWNQYRDLLKISYKDDCCKDSDKDD